MPPPRRASKFFEPVVMCTRSARRSWMTVALENPRGKNLFARLCDAQGFGRYDDVEDSPSAMIFSAFCSDMPFIAINAFFGVYETDSIV